MNIGELINALKTEFFDPRIKELYGFDQIGYQKKRYIRAIEGFASYFSFPESQEVSVYSAPGRAEICGNHTDHQRGKVLAAAVDVDIIGVTARNTSLTRIKSEGYDEICLDKEKSEPEKSERGTPSALVRGIDAYFRENGVSRGSLCAFIDSEVPEGSGLSSSAAFETLIGCMLYSEFNANPPAPALIPKAGQYAENKYFGKPSGLMDQAASYTGGFAYIDFLPDEPVIKQIPLRPDELGYTLCVVHTGGGHASQTESYASITNDMNDIARRLGRESLGLCDEKEFINLIMNYKGRLNDRAILRSMHFFNENKRVEEAARLLITGRFNNCLALINKSGQSSFMYLQNVYSVKLPETQPLSLALALADDVLEGRGAFRVHGGGFAGTILAFVPTDRYEAFKTAQNGVFGANACRKLTVRQTGACKVM